MKESKILSDVDNAIMAIEFELTKRDGDINRALKRKRFEEMPAESQIKIGKQRELSKNITRLISAFRDVINAQLGRVPPNAVDLEEVVLGALMVDSGHPDIRSVTKYLRPDHFYQQAHEDIYTSILNLIREGNPHDMRAVVIQLRKDGKLSQVGGAHMIAELTSKVSSAANMEYHARVIIEMAMKRELITVASTIMMDAYDDTTDCFELLDYTEKKVNEISEWRKK